MRGGVLKEGAAAPFIAAVLPLFSDCPSRRGVGTSERAEGGSRYEVRQWYEVLPW
jgi:hypothetical protein